MNAKKRKKIVFFILGEYMQYPFKWIKYLVTCIFLMYNSFSLNLTLMKVWKSIWTLNILTEQNQFSRNKKTGKQQAVVTLEINRLWPLSLSLSLSTWYLLTNNAVILNWFLSVHVGWLNRFKPLKPSSASRCVGVPQDVEGEGECGKFEMVPWGQERPLEGGQGSVIHQFQHLSV